MKFIVFILTLFGMAVSAGGQSVQLNIKIGYAIAKFELKKSVKHPEDFVSNYRIVTSDDGIIARIEYLNNDDLVDPVSIEILREGNRLTINKAGYSVHTIQWFQDKVIVTGPVFTRNQSEPMTVAIDPEPGTIYDSPELLLRVQKPHVLQEDFKKTPSRFFARGYKNGLLIVHYRLSKQVNDKFLYKKGIDSIEATYYAPTDDDFDEYSPPVQIKGNSIHSTSDVVNVVNDLIVQVASSALGKALFPLIFLSDPLP